MLDEFSQVMNNDTDQVSFDDNWILRKHKMPCYLSRSFDLGI